MKYGFFFLLITLILSSLAIIKGGWFWLLIWPAISFGNVATGYLWRDVKAFGKCNEGTLDKFRTGINFPYLLYLWLLWHVVRLISREVPYNNLCDGILIGRLPVVKELPEGISLVVDLTAEFNERKNIRQGRTYWSFPILDASVPSLDNFAEMVKKIASWNGKVYIHCAQGHGRTGLVAAAVLLEKGLAVDPDDALAILHHCRPGITMNSRQKAFLKTYYEKCSQIQSIKSACGPPSSLR